MFCLFIIIKLKLFTYNNSMNNKDTKNIVISFSIIITSIVAVAFLGSLFVNIGMDWYALLNRPSQYAPNILFPIIWSIIYLSFIVILSIWEFKGKIPIKTIVLLIINGALNVLWCLVFFALNLMFIGLILIILNAVASIILWLSIYKYEKIYAYILSLYPLWIFLATCLNLCIWILN